MEQRGMKWGDTLYGVRVQPGDWQGGVVLDGRDGRWRLVTEATRYPRTPGAFSLVYDFDEAECRASDSEYTIGCLFTEDACAPIFPPRGWAGKSDAELWAALNEGLIHFFTAPGTDIWTLEIDYRGSMALAAGIPDCYGRCTDSIDLDDPAALVTALQNAQVLAQRLAQ